MNWELIAQGLLSTLTVRMVLAAFSAVVLHEFGHLLFGRIAGVPILGVVIGEGRRLFGWRIGATTFAVHAIPFSGHVEHDEYDGGPLTTAVLAGGGIAVNLLVGMSSLAFYLSGEPHWLDRMLWAIALAHLGLAAWNLVPRQFEDGNKSDGLLMWDAWRAARRDKAAAGQ
ncbi:site-2 protease family protein [Bradyrhizobium liaoningense]|uniref:site-2 protease family protein n=1 Tax=Bradyrhizobium liaoningense TaxID=43992 RepID=UPI001BA485BA|nr:site-2 protease family protein [Bradyrhizobium liaoningense]MBR0705675.1 site-2 protease family protein [Bradyrhizobium liaoningense]